MSALASAHASLAAHSKSFALAGRLLPAAVRDDAAVLYAWCRRCDDAIDRSPPAERALALAHLRVELAGIYATAPPREPLAAAFQQVVSRHRIPRRWPAALLAGFGMDVAGRRYSTTQALMLYCFRVAGTVGLMMARLMGVRDRRVQRHAAHLGMAMQLTNICRDVVEDWQDGRLYLPLDLYDRDGGAPGRTLDLGAAAGAVRRLLATADGLYRSGEAGLRALPFRCAVAIRTARLVYGEIGRVIARRRFRVDIGRAVVSRWRKAVLAMTALGRELLGRGW
jgi:15-cis-phytoene synthase